MLRDHKLELMKDNQETILVELIQEEIELKGNVQKIMYWSHNSAPNDLKTSNIVSACKTILHIMNKMTKEIDEEFKGPEHLVHRHHVPEHMPKPKHIAKIYKDNHAIVKHTQAMMMHVCSKDFSFSEQERKMLLDFCIKILKELDAHDFEIDAALEIIGVKK